MFEYSCTHVRYLYPGNTIVQPVQIAILQKKYGFFWRLKLFYIQMTDQLEVYNQETNTYHLDNRPYDEFRQKFDPAVISGDRGKRFHMEIFLDP